MDYEKMLQDCYEQYSRVLTVFIVFFWVRCACIHFGCDGVPNPWIIDHSWYFGVGLGLIITIPLVALYRSMYLK